MTRSAEGVSEGAEMKCCTARGSPGLIGNSRSLTVAWRAIVKLVLAVAPPTLARTLTRSPGEKRRDGRKLSPVPVE